MASSHTMYHKRGQLNGIWSDMVIEATFIKFGHSKGESLASPLNLNLSRYECKTLLRATTYRETLVI